ncbi:glycoside hydrolase [Lasiosphaeria ovina]|uniref:lytic cellulose monooxygenase (C4-dehydrogenating) n=1 Tax=Lasiosphaeria ovina TaxID=92902 RepID=A0AAE0KH52_9PEZI|nr:glycoside hydrolase [Lasiosphaeria ovina]
MVIYVTVNATLPALVPNEEYLLQVESIALYMAMQAKKAQSYISCPQIRVTGGGNGTPGPLVALPRAYKTNDPEILVNMGAI